MTFEIRYQKLGGILFENIKLLPRFSKSPQQLMAQPTLFVYPLQFIIKKYFPKIVYSLYYRSVPSVYEYMNRLNSQAIQFVIVAKPMGGGVLYHTPPPPTQQ